MARNVGNCFGVNNDIRQGYGMSRSPFSVYKDQALGLVYEWTQRRGAKMNELDQRKWLLSHLNLQMTWGLWLTQLNA